MALCSSMGCPLICRSLCNLGGVVQRVYVPNCQITCQNRCHIECQKNRGMYPRKYVRIDASQNVSIHNIYTYICIYISDILPDSQMVCQKRCQNSVSGWDHSKKVIPPQSFLYVIFPLWFHACFPSVQNEGTYPLQ